MSTEKEVLFWSDGPAPKSTTLLGYLSGSLPFHCFQSPQGEWFEFASGNEREIRTPEFWAHIPEGPKGIKDYAHRK